MSITFFISFTPNTVVATVALLLTCKLIHVSIQSIVQFESSKKGTFWSSTIPPRRSCRLIRVLHSFVRKVAQKMQFPYMAIGNVFELSDKISAGGYIWGRF